MDVLKWIEIKLWSWFTKYRDRGTITIQDMDNGSVWYVKL